MNRFPQGGAAKDFVDKSDIELVYGEDDGGLATVGKRDDFKAWHHPVKQFVREEQWRKQLDRLLGEKGLFEDGRPIHYLSLPGEDMFDVRVLGELARDKGRKIRLLGFNSDAYAPGETGGQLNSESVLRQEGIITNDSLTLGDRLQDIAVERSHVFKKMEGWGRFDVINLDFCNHIGAKVEGIGFFDVLYKLVSHQRSSSSPWLLMLTTRVHPDHVEVARESFSGPIDSNIKLSDEFCQNLAGILNIEVCSGEGLSQCWGASGESLVKLFSVGLGKFILHLLHNQVQDPASVELASCFSYRVEGDHLDMLSVVFRITPGDKVLIPVDNRVVNIPALEIASALQIVRKSGNICDVDSSIKDPGLLNELVEATEKLLSIANYDVDKYKDWLRTRSVRACAV